MTAADIRDLIVEVIAGATDTPAERWRKIVGDIECASIVTKPTGNWWVSPKGKAADVAIVRQAAGLVKAEHPYVDHRL